MFNPSVTWSQLWSVADLFRHGLVSRGDTRESLWWWSRFQNALITWEHIAEGNHSKYCISMEQGPISQKFYKLMIQFMTEQNLHHLSNLWTAQNLFHGLTAMLLRCAKLWSDMIKRIDIRTKINFRRFWHVLMNHAWNRSVENPEATTCIHHNMEMCSKLGWSMYVFLCV